MGGGAVITGGEGGTKGPFFGVSHESFNSNECFPGMIGGGGIPGPFFLIVVLIVLTCGFAG